MNALNIINKTQLLPLTTLVSRDDVEPLCNILMDVSIPLVEITLRDERTLEIVDEFKKFPEINLGIGTIRTKSHICLLYTSPSPRDVEESRMPSSA